MTAPYTRIPRSFCTHDGSFHADEVSACAVLLVYGLIDKDKIIRSRSPHDIACADFVCDVGGIWMPSLHLFDHHQSNYTGDLSSVGMVLAYLRDEKCISLDEYTSLNEQLILGIDAHDNGKVRPQRGHCSFSQVIANFNPIAYDVGPKEQMDAFLAAVDFCCGHLQRQKERYLYRRSCEKEVSEAMARDKDCLYFDRPLPWLESFFERGGDQHPARFVLMPTDDHNGKRQWKLRAIPPSLSDRMNVRQALPLAWAGQLDEDLEKISGIKGAVFCHKGRFVSVWKSKEAAVSALIECLKDRCDECI